jgi:hypothetical protein
MNPRTTQPPITTHRPSAKTDPKASQSDGPIPDSPTGPILAGSQRTGGVITVILNPPGSIVKFFQKFVSSDVSLLPEHVRDTLMPVVAGICLTTSTRRSLTAIGGAVYTARRHKATVSRMLSRCVKLKPLFGA